MTKAILQAIGLIAIGYIAGRTTASTEIEGYEIIRQDIVEMSRDTIKVFNIMVKQGQ